MKSNVKYKLVALVTMVMVLGINLAPAIYNKLDQDVRSSKSIATNISVGGLHSATNARRTNVGLSAYKLNSRLNQAALGKANHMLANNYWAHVAPDGTTPWYFIGNAGYSYKNAGENLAYGFATSSDTITGWANSPAHNANQLSSNFIEVGYGIASGSFQGGTYTIVVAMYGNPLSPAPPVRPEPTPEPAPAAEPEPEASPAPEKQITTPIQPQEQQQVEPEPEPAAEPEADEPAENAEEPAESAKPDFVENITPDDQGEFAFTVSVEHISNYQALMNGNADVSLIASLAILVTALAYFSYKHVTIVRESVISGEKLLQEHPFVETLVIIVTIYLVLSASFGFIL